MALLLLLAIVIVILGNCGAFSENQQQVLLKINTTAPVAKIDDNFLCATLDWWPPEKCDYGTCSWGRASLLNLDLTNQRFQKAVKGLSPILLRLGGSLQDQIIYEVGNNPGACLPLVKKPSSMFGFTGGCLNMSRWQELNNFFKQTGASVAFGLNALYGRGKSTSGPWNSSNARSLIQFSVDHGHQIIAWELGNELSGSGVGTSIAAKQYAADMKELRSVVDSIYAGFSSKPLVVAPDGFFDASWYKEMLQDSGPNVVDVCSHHIYNLGPGVDTHLVEKILNPAYLSQEASTFQSMESILKNFAPWAQAWVGEAGGAYNSGHHNVTDRFVFSFWYLDQLGMSAFYNTTVYCRQSLIGGNYGLISTSFDLNPDYFAALLWKKLMGKTVFSATQTTSSYLRTYAHCLNGIQGGIAVLLINLSNSTQYLVDLSLTEAGKSCPCEQEHRLRTKKIAGSGVNAERMEYHLTAPDGNLQSPIALLNGKPLEASGDGSIPALYPIITTSSLPVKVAPFSIVFAAIPNAGVPLCRQTA